MPKLIYFDTETDGKYFYINRPFSYQYAINNETPIYKEINKTNIQEFISLISEPDVWLIGHNIKFDCHMMVNVGVPIELFKNVRLIDTMFMARLAIDHTEQAGNIAIKKPPIKLGLKELANKYLGIDARYEEQQLKEEFRKLNLEHKNKFINYLNQIINKKLNTTTINKYYNFVESDLYFNDFTFDPQCLRLSKEWLLNNPKPTYKDIPEYVLKPYALKDIILTRSLFQIFMRNIKEKQQIKIFIRESKALYPLLLMEREGLAIDKKEAINKYKELTQKRKILSVVYAPITLIKSGSVPIKVHQTYIGSLPDNIIYNKDDNTFLEYNVNDILCKKGDLVNTRSVPQMAALYSYETNEEITKANKEIREQIMNRSPTARKIQTLRPLDKIIDTYLKRLINETIFINNEWRLFGAYNNLSDFYNDSAETTGTVTGRLSSDLQQFPKEPLLDENGNELINIRRLFIKPKNAYAMLYFDMNQLELKLQTIWSAIIDGSPDPIMARGFAPYNCTEKFDVNQKSLGWFLNEDLNTLWTPTDFHSKTAYEAFGQLPDYEQNKKHYRTLGKRANFAIGYGAGVYKLMEALKVNEQTANRLITGWKKAYKGLTSMSRYLRNATKISEYQMNLFGRRYYTRDEHKLKNWLVQGSGGDLLKIFLIRLIPFIEKYPHWKFMLTVHDEIDFVLMKKPAVEEINEILNLMKYTAFNIVVDADAEITYTSWADKQNLDINNLK